MMLRAKVALFLGLTLAMLSLMGSIVTLPRIPNYLRLIQETMHIKNSQEENHTSTDRRSGIITLIGNNTSSYEGVSNMTGFEKSNPLDDAIEESTTIAELRQTTLAGALGSSIPQNNATEELPLLSTPSTIEPFNQTFNSKQREPSLEKLSNSRVSSYYFVNRIMTTRDPVNPSCHRSCVDFRNRIYYSPPVGDPGAGLIDRLTIFGTLLNMAGYLCARVYAPRPRFLLHVHHNFDQKLEANMSWSEFGDFVLWNDPQRHPALIDWDNPDDLNEWPIPESVANMTYDRLHYSVLPRQVRIEFPNFEKYTLDQQDRLKRNEPAGDGFIWSIGAEYFEWSDMLANRLRKRSPPKQNWQKETEPTIFAEKEFMGCQYAKVGLTQNTRKVQERIIHEILRQPESFPNASLPPLVGYLHIRRQDASVFCNTDIRLMAVYLRCSLTDAITRLSEVSSLETREPSWQNMIVLFSSDDRTQYRSKILQLIQQQQSSRFPVNKHTINVTAVDFDELVDRAIRVEIQSGRMPARQLNNFHIFQLILSIGYNQSVVKFHMEQRREGACRSCANVTEQLIESGVFGINGYPMEQTVL